MSIKHSYSSSNYYIENLSGDLLLFGEWIYDNETYNYKRDHFFTQNIRGVREKDCVEGVMTVETYLDMKDLPWIQIDFNTTVKTQLYLSDGIEDSQRLKMNPFLFFCVITMMKLIRKEINDDDESFLKIMRLKETDLSLQVSSNGLFVDIIIKNSKRILKEFSFPKFYLEEIIDLRRFLFKYCKSYYATYRRDLLTFNDFQLLKN